ncbi:hypothetical protein MBLNU13_g02666t2 [Cladosporium sp. NU13]
MPKASSQMSVKTFTSETLRNFSPCNSPTCEFCELNLSQVDSASMSSWKMVSKSPVGPSTQDVFAVMEAADAAEPPADNESSSRMSEMMNAARARAGFVPGTSASRAKKQAPLPLTPKRLDFDKRVEAAIAKSSALIAEAKAQLATPKVAPEELTEEEEEEARRNKVWDLQYQQKKQAIEEAMERNQALFENVMGTIDGMEAKWMPMPGCSDLDFSWKSNAGFAGTSSKTRR